LEEKKGGEDSPALQSALITPEEQQAGQEEAGAGVAAAILGHHTRTQGLAAARARGGIFTARPWVVQGSETESETEEVTDSLQGIIRAHSFRLGALQEEDTVFRVGKVSSIRAKFSRRSPDGASDDYLADSDRNV